jgi:ribosomal protein S18 acetylase RimI-like enzyme
MSNMNFYDASFLKLSFIRQKGVSLCFKNYQISMQFINSTIADHALIFEFYDMAVAYQKTVFHKNWAGFDEQMVMTEISEGRQWQIRNDEGAVLCIFATTFSDADIWREKNEEPSIYIHRIVTNPAFRGGHYVNDIIAWAKNYGRANGKKFLRIDTWGDNPRLVSYYERCGFRFVETVQITSDMDLPKHYDGISLALLEIAID